MIVTPEKIYMMVYTLLRDGYPRTDIHDDLWMLRDGYSRTDIHGGM